MAERRWISREEIAEIHDQRATLKAAEGMMVPGLDEKFLQAVHEVDKCMTQAQGYREIEKVYSPNLDSHIHNTQLANKTGHYAR